ncbi:MAG: hypothetical protein GX181_02550 [Synergistaceae bacterium]|nr:hypothetical protein [Synergistota bacterium]NLM70828.1 hypothetical protein [Synergistaceae bacterium]
MSTNNHSSRHGRRTLPPCGFKRVLHDLERRYLAPDAQAAVYHYLITEEIPFEVTERAILEAVSLARLKNSTVDAPLLACLVDALLDDCSFEIPGTASERLYPASCTLC